MVDGNQVEPKQNGATQTENIDNRQVQPMQISDRDRPIESGSLRGVEAIPSQLKVVMVSQGTEPIISDNEEDAAVPEALLRERELVRNTYTRVEHYVRTLLPALQDDSGQVSLANIIRMDRQSLHPQRLCTVR